MTGVRWAIVAFCLIASAALIAVDLVLAMRGPATTQTQREEVRGGIPGSEVVKDLAAKSPRLAAALAFVLIAALCSDVLHMAVDAGG